MALRPRLHGIALCAGVGGLELGLHIAEPRYRTVCYVEREAFAAAALVARMEDEALDRAPVWDDVATFDGRRWRGCVDIVTAGYPCQPFSTAGRRLGHRDPRHLWPHVRRIIVQCRPRRVFLENVGGHLSLGFETVHRELSRLGYEVAARLQSAAETGASHERERLFIMAGRAGPRCGDTEDARADHPHARRSGKAQGWWTTRREQSQRGRSDVADAAHRSGQGHWPPEPGEGAEHPDGGRALGLATSEAWRQPPEPAGEALGLQEAARRVEPGRSGGGHAADALGPGLGDAVDRGCAGAVLHAGRRPEGPGESRAERPGRELPVYPPGPGERERWAAILAEHPHLAPALPRFRRVADGLAARLDDPGAWVGSARADRLRATGNGVVPLAAAVAYLALRKELECRSSHRKHASGAEHGS